MNDFDIGVMRRIETLYRLGGKYPTQVVVPDNYVKFMSRRAFFFLQEPRPCLVLDIAEGACIPAIPRTYDRVQVDVVTESEYVEESRQRAAKQASMHLRDYLGAGQ